MKLESLPTLLDAGGVVRCHTLPCLNRPTVGHHTWRTMVILHWLYSPGLPPSNMTYALLIHDMPELWTGDMPGDVKGDYPEVAAMFTRLDEAFEAKHELVTWVTPSEQCLVSYCDRADLTLYALDEIESGNKRILPLAFKAKEMTQALLVKVRNSLLMDDIVLASAEYLFKTINERFVQLL